MLVCTDILQVVPPRVTWSRVFRARRLSLGPAWRAKGPRRSGTAGRVRTDASATPTRRAASGHRPGGLTRGRELWVCVRTRHSTRPVCECCHRSHFRTLSQSRQLRPAQYREAIKGSKYSYLQLYQWKIIEDDNRYRCEINFKILHSTSRTVCFWNNYWIQTLNSHIESKLIMIVTR